MMEKTWRWFGKKDKITLPMLRQIGVEGIVTALHEVPNGEIWTVEAINDLKSYIESYGLRWSVVESLPVCEAIKYAGTEREQLIENYKGNERIDEVTPKYALLSTHAGRRTFICNALALGIPAQVVMKWTGHSDYKAMKPYIDIADDIKANAMNKFNQL